MRDAAGAVVELRRARQVAQQQLQRLRARVRDHPLDRLAGERGLLDDDVAAGEERPHLRVAGALDADRGRRVGADERAEQRRVRLDEAHPRARGRSLQRDRMPRDEPARGGVDRGSRDRTGDDVLARVAHPPPAEIGAPEQLGDRVELVVAVVDRERGDARRPAARSATGPDEDDVGLAHAAPHPCDGVAGVALERDEAAVLDGALEQADVPVGAEVAAVAPVVGDDVAGPRLLGADTICSPCSPACAAPTQFDTAAQPVPGISWPVCCSDHVTKPAHHGLPLGAPAAARYWSTSGPGVRPALVHPELARRDLDDAARRRRPRRRGSARRARPPRRASS